MSYWIVCDQCHGQDEECPKCGGEGRFYMYTSEQRRSLLSQAFAFVLLALAVFLAAYKLFGCAGGQ